MIEFRTSIRTFIISLLLLAVTPLIAQKAAGIAPKQSPDVLDLFSRFRHYTMEQGLSNNSVSSIVQDDDGFLWFGTEEGLNRFDGERFSAFFHNASGKGLPNDHIIQMAKLTGNRILIGSEKGLCILHTRTLRFEPIPLPNREGQLMADDMIGFIFVDSKNQCWIATEFAVYVLNDRFQIIHSLFKPAKANDNNNGTYARGFMELPNGLVVVKFASFTPPYNAPWQVIDFQSQTTAPLCKLIPTCSPLDSAQSPGSIFCDGKNSIWYTTINTYTPTHVYRFDWAAQKAEPIIERNFKDPQAEKYNSFGYPSLISDSLIFLERYFGAPIVYNQENGTITDLPQWKSSFPDGKHILNFQDRDGNLWLCPRFEGIYFLTLKNLPTTPMTALNTAHKKVMADTKVSEEWFGFISTNWAGKWVVSSGNGGLYSMNKSDRGVTGNVLTNPFHSYAYGSAFAPDRGDTIWMTSLGGLTWYNPVSNTNGLLSKLVPGLDSLNGRFLFRDHRGRIWSRVYNNGVCFFDTRTRKFFHFPSIGANPPFPIVSATACSEGPDGDMWFCFGNEKKYIVRWRQSTGTFEKIAPDCPPGVDCAQGFEILADKRNNVWLNTGQKWYIMDVSTRKVQNFGKKNGLSTNKPNGLCLDRDGNVWFATPYGLSRYEASSHQVRTFYQTDGLLSNIISNVELIDTSKNILFVSTDRGLCLFEPDKVDTATAAPHTLVTRIQVFDNEIPIPENGGISLAYNQNDLRIEFTGVNFINGANNRYQYSLEPEGSPADWKDAGTDNFANFLNLSPGRYTFYARTANSDGIWGETPAVLSILIYPPWWQTWTFRISLLAALAAAIWWFYRRQISRAETREAEKAKVRQQMADLEMRALRSQMNPHFVFNALNSVQNFILKNDTREASRYLTKFARLMRLILENSESPVVPLDREIELLRYYTEMEALRFNQHFAFDFQIDTNLSAESVAIPGMLIQPHIENAIWHGLMHKEDAGAKLWVRFIKAENNTIICEIEDNGVGRAKAAELEQDRPKNHRSTGLSNIRTRLELLNAQLANDISLEFNDLHDEMGNATGTKVVVRMPMMAVQPITASKN
ncbi:MAG: histidine kinase [Bacteroidota bacterium]